MTWKWVLGGLFLLGLLLLVVRERYQNYEEALRDVGQTAGYITPKCPDGYTISTDRKACEKPKPDGSMERVDPTCPSGSTFVKQGVQGQCQGAPAGQTSTEPTTTTPTEQTETSPTAAETETSTPAETAMSTPPVPGSSGTGATSGTTTGGTSGTTFGPTSAPTGGRNVWGPIFKGVGQGDGPQGGDSTKSNPYPALMGGMQGRSSTRIEGVGVVPPSGVGLDSVMPSSSALGTDANSRFLPYSRQPGDMDIFPDPYRLATNFSSSSYSASKTDPVPFLTDFSAFYR